MFLVVVVEEEATCWSLVKSILLFALAASGVALLVACILGGYFFYLGTAIPIVYAGYLCFKAKKKRSVFTKKKKKIIFFQTI